MRLKQYSTTMSEVNMDTPECAIHVSGLRSVSETVLYSEIYDCDDEQSASVDQPAVSFRLHVVQSPIFINCYQKLRCPSGDRDTK